jgi:hypothetical protein
MPPRYTIRQVVGTYRRKAFGTKNGDGSERRPAYPADAIVAFYGMLELAEEQPVRGRFESERLLRTLLEGPLGTGRRYARQVPFLIDHGDLVPDGAALNVEGWSLLQEGSDAIRDRMGQFNGREHQPLTGAERTKKWRERKAAVTPVTSRDGDDGDTSQRDAVTSHGDGDAGDDGSRAGDTRAQRRGEGEGEGFGGGSGGEPKPLRARSNGLARIALDDLPAALRPLDELPTDTTTTTKETSK